MPRIAIPTLLLAAAVAACDSADAERWFTDRVADTQMDDRSDSCGSGACTQLCPEPYRGELPCLELSPLQAAIIDELATSWQTQPAYVCSFATGDPPSVACPGQVPPAAFCFLDRGVVFEQAFL